MTTTTSPTFSHLAGIVIGASLLQLAAPFRFQFGIPGLQADFSANFGGASNIGNAFSNLAFFGGGSSGSSSSSSASRNSWPWSQAAAISRRQPEDMTTPAVATAAALSDVNSNAVSPAAAAIKASGGFGLWDSIPFAGGGRGGAAAVRGDVAVGGVSPEDGIIFNLFTRKNNGAVRLFARDISTIRGSTFNPKRKTKMIIHGFTSNTKEGSAGDLIKDIFLRVADVNVILVDWNGVDPHVYPIDASSTVPMVGAVVADLVKALVGQAGADEDDFHIIGHSLGAHVAGVAGSIALGPLGKGLITGLDPAGPLFEGTDAGRRLDPSDAGFVEAVHTDGGFLGIVQPVGHVDWFVNTGMHRHPDCGSDILGLCSHCFAFEVFAHALANRNALVGTKCDSLDDYQAGSCERNQRLAMNIGVRHKGRGMFYIDTELKPSEGLRGIGAHVITPIINKISRYIIPRGNPNDPFIRC